MKNIPCIFVCMCGMLLADNVQSEEGIRYHFTGSIDGKYPIFMVLSVNDLDVNGMYYYYSIGTPIDLGGTCARDGSFIINEFLEDGSTGTFKGAFVNGFASAKGTWTDAAGAKEFPFSLKLIAGETVLTSRTYEVTAHIPRFTGRCAAIQEIVSDTITVLFNGFIADYGVDMESEPEWGWEFICDYSIQYYSEYFTSILLEVYEHTGGAHGNVYYVSLNAIEEKGSASFLDLDDLFLGNVDYETVLSELLITALEKQEAAWILDGSIKTIDPDLLVYNVAPGGVLFTFAPYAVGPYSEGPHQVTVSYKKIEDLIDTRGPLGEFVK